MCLLLAGSTLTTSTDKATVGQYFTFTCVSTDTFIIFDRDSTNICVIIGGDTDGTCVLDETYETNYTYTCNPTTNRNYTRILSNRTFTWNNMEMSKSIRRSIIEY